MGKCNLFKSINSSTGTFLTFSQYAEDLTKELTQKDNYRVVPSKFMAMEIGLDGFGNPDNTTQAIQVSSAVLGEIFQNHFENTCTYWRDEKASDWDPEMSRSILMETLQRFNLCKVDRGVCSAIKYIGDINVNSHQEIDGTGYNEIYCLIPDDAQETLYTMGEYSDEENEKEEGRLTGETIIGWVDDYPVNSTIENITTNYYDKDENDGESIVYLYNNYTVEELEGGDTNETLSTASKFSINSVVVFYDIYVNNGTEVKKNIPLGIYFTGAVDNKTLTNTITKYVNNDDINGEGTSYGLRICSRYLATPNITQTTAEVSTSAEFIQGYSELTGLMKDSLEAMDTIIGQNVVAINDYKTQLALFKANKTNVPYINYINDTGYWYVNGKNTEVRATPIDSSELFDDVLERVDEYLEESNASITEYMEEQTTQITASINNLESSYITVESNNSEKLLEMELLIDEVEELLVDAIDVVDEAKEISESMTTQLTTLDSKIDSNVTVLNESISTLDSKIIKRVDFCGGWMFSESEITPESSSSCSGCNEGLLVLVKKGSIYLPVRRIKRDGETYTINPGDYSNSVVYPSGLSGTKVKYTSIEDITTSIDITFPDNTEPKKRASRLFIYKQYTIEDPFAILKYVEGEWVQILKCSENDEYEVIKGRNTATCVIDENSPVFNIKKTKFKLTPSKPKLCNSTDLVSLMGGLLEDYNIKMYGERRYRYGHGSKWQLRSGEVSFFGRKKGYLKTKWMKVKGTKFTYIKKALHVLSTNPHPRYDRKRSFSVPIRIYHKNDTLYNGDYIDMTLMCKRNTIQGENAAQELVYYLSFT